MKQTLLRLREPAVLVVLVVLLIRVLLAPASFAYFMSGGAGENDPALALFSVSYTATDPLTVVVLAALVACCVLIEPSPHARTLTVWSLVIAGLGVLLALAAAIGWILQVRADGALVSDAARMMLGLVVPVLAVVALMRLLRAQPRESAQASLETGPAPEQPKAVEAVPDPAKEPTWQRDVASGAAWLKAGDAAAGAAATGWGNPGDDGGWQPEPRDGRTDEQLDERPERDPRPPQLEQRPRP